MMMESTHSLPLHRSVRAGVKDKTTTIGRRPDPQQLHHPEAMK